MQLVEAGSFLTPNPMSISTKKGDEGMTDLMYGRRVSKTEIRVEAGGAIDELNASLGLARVSSDCSGVGALPNISEDAA